MKVFSDQYSEGADPSSKKSVTNIAQELVYCHKIIISLVLGIGSISSYIVGKEDT